MERDESESPNSQTEVGGRPGLDEIKQMRKDRPSGWLELSMTPARALLIDAILDSPPSHEFTTGTISERAGITPQAVRDHLDVLLEHGVVEEVDGSAYRVVDESVVLQELQALNSAVGAVRAGVTDERIDRQEPDERVDNAGNEGPVSPHGRVGPQQNGRALNAD